MLTLFKDSLRPLYRFFTSRNYRTHYRQFSKYATAERYKITHIDFLGYQLTVPDPVSFAHQFKEIFVEQSYKFTASTSKPLIYDCGANIGLSCIYFKELFPDCTIKAFEADPEIFKILTANINQNLNAATVQCFNKAIWIDNEGVEFNAEGSDGGSILGTSTARTVKIESQRLRDLLTTETIDLLKIDIEGAEADVILDCDGHFEKVKNVFFEYHSFADQPQRLNELLDVMTRNGFRYYIQPPYHRDSPFIPASKEDAMDLQLNIYCHKS